jgi:molybdopterin-containing oxidoreductase family membrane subunit
MAESKQKLMEFRPLIEGEQTFESIDQKVADLVLHQKGRYPVNLKSPWYIIMGTAIGIFHLLILSVGWLLYQGIGIWGNNVPTAWAFDIINFVWWIGIGHAGTLISAILLLMRQNWRNSINRFAEAMTIFAVMCAGLYPLLHTGRPWVAYWLFPLPNITGMWPNFRSPLMWDVFAVSTYFTVSALFWFVGLIPDFATMRDRAEKLWIRKLFGLLSMGWRGASRHWHRYEQAYLLLAGLSTPLVLSVHTIVSYDFAVSIVPGWNVTVFPPYFVAGAVFAGFAMVLLLAIPVRKWFGWTEIITDKHIDWMTKIMLATGLIVFYGYILEVFYGWYSGTSVELKLLNFRFSGPYAWAYWSLIFCNGIAIQPLWSQKNRRKEGLIWLICLLVSVGMWLERFVIIPMSLMQNYLPSSDKNYYPTVWDFGMFLGTIGMFFMFMFLFLRFLPVINIFEMKDLLYKTQGEKAATAREKKPATTPSGGE